jgi:hypothetical protein
MKKPNSIEPLTYAIINDLIKANDGLDCIIDEELLFTHILKDMAIGNPEDSKTETFHIIIRRERPDVFDRKIVTEKNI